MPGTAASQASRDEAASVPVAPSSQSDRFARGSDGYDRRASGGRPWPFGAAVEQLGSIPGIKDVGAQVIISEIGLGAKRLVAQLANLGFDAKLTPFAQAA
jgi:hypothetical protein